VIVNTLDQIATKYVNHPRTPSVRKTAPKKTEKTKKTSAKTTKTKKVTKTTKRQMPAYLLSPSLAAVIGTEELTRSEVIKRLWDYIKAHQLQSTENKRLIKPDASLAKVFGSQEPIDMLKLAGLIGPHLKKKP
jgi:DNA topoisomerase-1